MKFYSGFDFDLFIVTGMQFCTGPPNFIGIISATELWRHIDFPRWRPCRRKLTSVLGYGYVSRFWIYRAICVQNVDQISQRTAEILLLPLPKSKRSPYWNSTSGLNVDLFTAVGMCFCISLPNFVQIRWSSTEYDVISILQDSGHRVANLLLVSGLAMPDI